MVYPTISEAEEIAVKGHKLLVAQFNPFASKETKQKLFREFMDSLKEETFNNNIQRIFDMINFSEKTSRKYKNADEETIAHLEMWPRLKSFRNEMYARVLAHRKAHGLE